MLSKSKEKVNIWLMGISPRSACIHLALAPPPVPELGRYNLEQINHVGAESTDELDPKTGIPDVSGRTTVYSTPCSAQLDRNKHVPHVLLVSVLAGPERPGPGSGHGDADRVSGSAQVLPPASTSSILRFSKLSPSGTATPSRVLGGFWSEDREALPGNRP